MSASLASLCVPATFGSLGLFGAKTVSVDASVSRFNGTVANGRLSSPTAHVNIEFCNVTVSYTHPGQNDLLHVETWLPPAEGWNDVLLAVGGGGLAAGRQPWTYWDMAASASRGYAVVTTDAGVGPGDPGDPWAHLSPGNANLVNLHNFAARALGEQGLLGKQAVAALYGRAQKRAYFRGCSQGGRQGLALSQRYPDLYDGIMANAPAVKLISQFAAIHEPQQHMVDAGEVPRECEINAITAAAIEFCDGLDGVLDGVVSEPRRCLDKFDPDSVVGRTVPCADAPSGGGGQQQTAVVGATAAGVVKAAWHGPRLSSSSGGRQIWPGFHPGSDLTGRGPRYSQPGGSVANTDCDAATGVCVGRPWAISEVAFRGFLARDMTLELANLTRDEFERYVRFGQREYKDLDNEQADLTDFQRAGGKMITYHGLYDDILPAQGSANYYDKITAVSPDVHDFYRLFEVPGLNHCGGGESSIPYRLFDQLRAWVENGTAPASTPHELYNTVTRSIDNRLACAYPAKPVFDKATCGDVASEACWRCPGKANAARRRR